MDQEFEELKGIHLNLFMLILLKWKNLSTNQNKLQITQIRRSILVSRLMFGVDKKLALNKKRKELRVRYKRIG